PRRCDGRKISGGAGVPAQTPDGEEPADQNPAVVILTLIEPAPVRLDVCFIPDASAESYTRSRPARSYPLDPPHPVPARTAPCAPARRCPPGGRSPGWGSG